MQRKRTFSFSDATANSLAVKTDSRHSIEILIEFESVQGSCLSGTIETKHRHVKRGSRGKCLEKTAARATPTHPSAHPSFFPYLILGFCLGLSRLRFLFLLSRSSFLLYSLVLILSSI